MVILQNGKTVKGKSTAVKPGYYPAASDRKNRSVLGLSSTRNRHTTSQQQCSNPLNTKQGSNVEKARIFTFVERRLRSHRSSAPRRRQQQLQMCLAGAPAITPRLHPASLLLDIRRRSTISAAGRQRKRERQGQIPKAWKRRWRSTGYRRMRS